eukprot:4405426-Pyramimonas_sp.AAC.1
MPHRLLTQPMLANAASLKHTAVAVFRSTSLRLSTIAKFAVECTYATVLLSVFASATVATSVRRAAKLTGQAMSTR